MRTWLSQKPRIPGLTHVTWPKSKHYQKPARLRLLIPLYEDHMPHASVLTEGKLRGYVRASRTRGMPQKNWSSCGVVVAVTSRVVSTPKKEKPKPKLRPRPSQRRLKKGEKQNWTNEWLPHLLLLLLMVMLSASADQFEWVVGEQLS